MKHAIFSILFFLPLTLAVVLKSDSVISNATVGLEARAGTFTNPLNKQRGADPCMRYINGQYFLTSTQNANIQMWSASTVEGLKTATPTVIFSDTTAGRNFDFWAPEFWYLNGRWYLYYSVAGNSDDATHRLHVAQGGTDANNPKTSYTYVNSLIASNLPDSWAADGSILQLNGKLYFVFSAILNEQALWIAPMSSPTALSGQAVQISTPTLSWEISGFPVQEGPEVIVLGGVTQIVYSASFCGTDDYALGLLTLKSGADPLVASSWTKSPNPLFSKNPSASVYGPGHHFMFQKGSNWYFAYHAKSVSGEGCGNTRTTRVQPFSVSGNKPVFPLAVATGVAVAEPV